ncbi:MAG: cyclic nucleotide-binding domain-containing protein [Xanthobacteraceae bacterium]|nr:cyclic nucleotide-binding domain-containing protein [Xanthobacteraceae bacterium]
MTIEDDIAFLERIPILRRLGAPALRILAIGAESYRVEAGQVLFAAGETADGAYIVQQGSFNLRPQAGAEADVVAGPGTLLGEAALLAETTRLATVTAREPSTVLRVPRAMFLKMLEGYPDAAQRLREVIAARADEWARDIENVRAALAAGSEPK